MQQCGRRFVLTPLCGTKNHRGGHGSSGTLAAYIADDDPLALAWEDAAVVEIASYFAYGMEGNGEAETGKRVESAGSEKLLDLLGGLEFSGEDGSLASNLLLFTGE